LPVLSGWDTLLMLLWECLGFAAVEALNSWSCKSDSSFFFIFINCINSSRSYWQLWISFCSTVFCFLSWLISECAVLDSLLRISYGNASALAQWEKILPLYGPTPGFSVSDSHPPSAAPPGYLNIFLSPLFPGYVSL
jgi:hypothetical protein